MAPRGSALVAGCLAMIACGGADGARGVVTATPPELLVPGRAPTIGDAAWTSLPAGADVVVEVDLARARANLVVGEVIGRGLEVLSAAPDAGDLPVALPAVALANVDALVLAAYQVGSADAATATLLRPRPGVDPAAVWPLATPTDDGWWLLAPPGWREAAVDGPRLRDDRELAALRARAMPAAATGATVRVTARLASGARTALALIGVSPPPRLLNLWGDLADDAALVVELDASDVDDAAPSERVVPGLRTLLARLGGVSSVRALGLVPALDRATITAFDPWVRLVVVVSPERLKRVADRARLGLPPPPVPEEPAA